MMMADTNFYFRLMIEVRDKADALEHAGNFRRNIENIAEVVSCTVEQYWKIPAYQDMTFYLMADDELAAFDKLKALAYCGWTSNGDDYFRTSVWNPEEESIWDEGRHHGMEKLYWLALNCLREIVLVWSLADGDAVGENGLIRLPLWWVKRRK